MKSELRQHCENFIAERIQRIQNQIKTISNSLLSETKSSAGDKHETGRAMLQLEREKLGVQLAEAERIKRILSKVSIKERGNKIGLGSFFRTNKHCYYIAISAGFFQIGDDKIFCISAKTPIGKQVLGKGVGDSFSINNVVQNIIEIA
jgi:hypothetical protein